jgi:hypothetical protein
MPLTIDLSPEQEAQLEAIARQRGVDAAVLAQQLLAESLPVTNTSAVRAAAHPMPPQEVIRALDELAELNRGLPVLPPEAFDRESIYEDLP